MGKNTKFDFRILPKKEYYHNIHSAHFSILPYKVISQSGVLLDNYACNTPVITSALPFFQEEVEKNSTGIVCRTTKDYENAMKKLFLDRPFYRQLQKNIKKRKRFFLVEKVASQHLAVYQKMMRETTNMEFRKNVSAVVISKGKVLITKKPNRESWQFPQGGIENGGNEKEAILRELHEELNITKINIMGKSKFTHQYDWPAEKQKQTGLQGIRQGLYYVSLNESPSNIKMDTDELEKFEWVEPDRIRSFFKFRNLLDLLDNIQEEMNQMVAKNK